MSEMTFKPLYYSDRLHLVNPVGDTGVLTLWSPPRAARRRLEEVSPGILDAGGSRVAVISNLYGDGMYAMFCNLLFNPQIRHLIAVGEDLGLPTCAEIQAFLDRGLEDAVILGRSVRRVRGTGRIIPILTGFDEDRLRRSLSFRYLGRLAGPELEVTLPGYLRGLPAAELPAERDRIRVDIPEFGPADFSYRPSEVTAHQVVRRGPLDCWEELVVRGIRFGRPVEVRSGPRLELLNVKAVVTDPGPDDEDALTRYGFRIEAFREYQRKMLDARLPEGVAYSYGNRLRGYFDLVPTSTDSLAAVIGRLRQDPASRRAYISLWDNTSDLSAGDQEDDGSVPCLVSLFFRRAEGRLLLTADYRSHNLLTAWLQNVYGLMAIQRHVAEAVGMEIGPITVISQSLGIDPRSPRYVLGRDIAEAWTRDDDVDRRTGRHSLREDPNGYFVVTIDEEDGCIVADHRFGGLSIKQYRSDRAARIEREISGDMAVSLVSHALWLGRELTTKEGMLRDRVRAKARAGGSRSPQGGPET
jgi:thymidylate synthase